MFSTDATKKKDSLCRYVNDSPKDFANAAVRWVLILNKVHICLFANADICRGTETRYVRLNYFAFFFSTNYCDYKFPIIFFSNCHKMYLLLFNCQKISQGRAYHFHWKIREKTMFSGGKSQGISGNLCW